MGSQPSIRSIDFPPGSIHHQPAPEQPGTGHLAVCGWDGLLTGLGLCYCSRMGKGGSGMSETMRVVTVVAAVLAGAVSTVAQAQQTPPQSPNMTFFVTSTGPGKGADLGGLEGADRQCQTLGQAAGAGSKTWHAYLSTQATGNAQAINARDRIGH